MSNNILSIIIGLAMIVSCCLIAYITQKKLFNKYRNKLNDTTMELQKKNEENN